MKKIILFILLLTGIPFLTETHASTKQQVRDSIFQAAATIPIDSSNTLVKKRLPNTWIPQSYLPTGSKYTKKNYGHFLIIAANMSILQIFSISKRGF